MSGRKVLVLCAFCCVATAALGVVFVETAYPSIRSRLQTILMGTVHEVPSDFRNPEVAKLAQVKYDKLIEKGNAAFSPEVLKPFITAYANLNIWENLYYLGIPILKYPNDLQMYHQILMETQPDLIVETGTFKGGTALFFAHTLDGLGLTNSRIITIDLFDYTKDVSKRPLWKKYVEFIHASSTDPLAVARVRDLARGKRVLVTLDSYHKSDHVFRELQLYSPLVTPGSYIVVEDTIMDGLQLGTHYGSGPIGPGPMAALNKFLSHGGSEMFEQDLTRDALVITQNRGGWLKRKPTP